MCCLLHCINQFCVNIFDILPLQQVQSQNIHVGDIVRVKRDESFPCDLVLISTSNNEGKCYITTANLDGETNLKVHFYRSFCLLDVSFILRYICNVSDTLQSQGDKRSEKH